MANDERREKQANAVAREVASSDARVESDADYQAVLAGSTTCCTSSSGSSHAAGGGSFGCSSASPEGKGAISSARTSMATREWRNPTPAPPWPSLRSSEERFSC